LFIIITGFILLLSAITKNLSITLLLNFGESTLETIKNKSILLAIICSNLSPLKEAPLILGALREIKFFRS